MVEARDIDRLMRPTVLTVVVVLGSLLYVLRGPHLGSFFEVLAVVLYRLTLHPLARYPGPLLGRITDWYTVYHAWKGDRHIDFYELHQKYGTIVRYGPSRISINSNTALTAIYTSSANVQKSNFYGVFTHFFHAESTQTIVNKAQHGRKRRVLSYALSDKALRAVEESMLQNARKFCAYLNDEGSSGDAAKSSLGSIGGWTTAKNVAHWASYLAFDTMGSICFGRPYDMMENDKNRYIIDVLGDGAQGLNIVGHMPVLVKLQLDKILFRKLMRGTQRYEAYSKAQSDTRISQDPQMESRDVFQFLLEAKDPETGQGFSMPELVSESSLLIIAGSDTTATVIAATIFYLLHNPATLEKLNAEIRQTFDDVEQIRAGPSLNGCHYLRACLNESMRLCPPVGGLMPREVMPGGIEIDGQFFPEGMDVGTPQYAIHHNERYYPEPFAYKPSRWLANSEPAVTAESVSLAQSAFCPFSIGPRGCVGKAMAYMEMSIVITRMVWLYDMRLAAGSEKRGGGNRGLGAGRQRENEFQQIDKFVSQVDGPVVEFKAR